MQCNTCINRSMKNWKYHRRGNDPSLGKRREYSFTQDTAAELGIDHLPSGMKGRRTFQIERLTQVKTEM